MTDAFKPGDRVWYDGKDKSSPAPAGWGTVVERSREYEYNNEVYEVLLNFHPSQVLTSTYLHTSEQEETFTTHEAFDVLENGLDWGHDMGGSHEAYLQFRYGVRTIVSEMVVTTPNGDTHKFRVTIEPVD